MQEESISSLKIGISNRNIATIVRAEKVGLDSAWVGDHFKHWSVDRTIGETWSTLTMAAAHTRRIQLGSGVTDPFRRSAALLAQSSATLDQLSNGRAFLGIGGGEKMNIVPFGISWNRPLARLKETVIAIRKLWEARWDNPLTFKGEFQEYVDAFLQIQPVKGKLPIFIAGDSRTSRLLAGELGDGWYSYIHSPKTFSEDIEMVYEGARRVGKPKSSVEAVIFLPCAINRNRESAWRDLAPSVCIQLVVARNKLSRLGYEISSAKLTSLSDLVLSAREIKRLNDLARRVPREAVEQVAAVGTPDDCVSIIERFANAGAQHVVLGLHGSDLNETFRLLRRYILPHIAKL